jgi:sec-independent protein translocase protein TatC
MLAVPMCLLYELGIMLANMISKPAAKSGSDYAAPTAVEMDRELDRIEDAERDSK